MTTFFSMTPSLMSRLGPFEYAIGWVEGTSLSSKYVLSLGCAFESVYERLVPPLLLVLEEIFLPERRPEPPCLEKKRERTEETMPDP